MAEELKSLGAFYVGGAHVEEFWGDDVLHQISLDELQ